ncbi:MAG: hypothetical protein WCG23_10775 [bacterium]
MRKNFILTILLGVLLGLNFTLPSSSKPDSNSMTENKKDFLQKKVEKNPLKQPILSMIETGLNSNTSQKGQQFNATLLEDVIYGGQTIIPKSSMVYGSVIKVKKSGKLDKDAFIQLKIVEIRTPDEKIISIEDKPMIVEVSQLAYTQKKESFLKNLPVTIAGTATSIVLGKFSSIADAAVWAISTGAEITTGFISGVISPDEGKSRGVSSAQRALNSSPLGSVSTVVKKGEDICLNPGQYICIFFDRETVKYIKENISCIQNNHAS